MDYNIFCYGGVAQLGEHLPCKQGVRSSILLISTKQKTPRGVFFCLVEEYGEENRQRRFVEAARNARQQFGTVKSRARKVFVIARGNRKMTKRRVSPQTATRHPNGCLFLYDEDIGEENTRSVFVETANMRSRLDCRVSNEQIFSVTPRAVEKM